MVNFLEASIFTVIACSVCVIAFADQIPEGVDSQAEVRAVFINCGQEVWEEESTEERKERFEREELFKHGALQDCRKKLAVTVKLYEPGVNNGEEYIPIEHVFDGPNKRRVRLLDPYVLRLRREKPLQAYQLKNVETIFASISSDQDHMEVDDKMILDPPQRNIRAAPPTEEMDLRTIQERAENDNARKSPYNNASNGCDREKRNDHNVIIEETPRNHFRRRNGENVLQPLTDGVLGKLDLSPSHTRTDDDRDIEVFIDKTTATEASYSNETKPKLSRKHKRKHNDEYTMYAIGDPTLWHTVHVQLFQKTSNEDGNTVWNNLNGGEPASVGSTSSVWEGQDMFVRYRPIEWVNQNAFTLQKTNLCLLVPKGDVKIVSDTNSQNENSNGFIVVPKEDIMFPEGPHAEQNLTKFKYSDTRRSRRKVTVRVQRAWIGGRDDSMSLVYRNSEDYLVLPHRTPHSAQIDLEARADDNHLVLVGENGRISTVVSESTRKTHSTITVHAANMGLAAANFRIVTRECGPNTDEGTVVADSVLVPPYHTRRFKFEIPLQPSTDLLHCSVALVNENDEAVAVRELIVKKGDRCFCVWHCDCSCLEDDPKLLCHEMSPAKLSAAGVGARRRVRHVRSLCYNDEVAINMSVLIVGVMGGLLFLGLVKACLGLIFPCVGTSGLEYVVRLPRRVERYHEPWLRARPVRHDDEGWPLHPDTMRRTVRSVSIPVEFLINVVYFLLVPALMVVRALRAVSGKPCSAGAKPAANTSREKQQYNCDSQESKCVRRSRRHRRRLLPWMSPDAALLSENIMSDAIPAMYMQTKQGVNVNQPLLQERRSRGSAAAAADDSEHEDAEYVLTQMQKSRESIMKPKLSKE